ncbi:hypothetical protein LCGC14_0819760 [marine sediment metagenome]|uniref:CR-type domain-containing protein n=1 Tax=marine sediment metagenome TaxID=412755 RepID=A0A0F9Q4J2_9ZZZZ
MTNLDVAFRRGKCKECHGLGYHNLEKCPKCSGSGETYLLGDMVRVKCQGSKALLVEAGLQYSPGRRQPHGVIKRLEKDVCQGQDCQVCHGLGFTPSTELGDWVKAAKARGYDVYFVDDTCRIEDKDGEWFGDDPDEVAALKLALGKALEGR